MGGLQPKEVRGVPQFIALLFLISWMSPTVRPFDGDRTVVRYLVIGITDSRYRGALLTLQFSVCLSELTGMTYKLRSAELSDSTNRDKIALDPRRRRLILNT